MSEEREGYIFVDAMGEADLCPSGVVPFSVLTGFTDVEADHYLVRRCAERMPAKLVLSRAKGRGGWHTSECNDEYLHKMLREHVGKGDMVDVLNIAGMILVRQEARARQESIPVTGSMPMLGPTGGPCTKAEKTRRILAAMWSSGEPYSYKSSGD